MRNVEELIRDLEQHRGKLEYQLDVAMNGRNYDLVSFYSTKIIGLREAIDIVRRWTDW